MQGPPPAKWERDTADTHTASRTWGLNDHMLHELAEAPTQAMLEVNSRLATLYPDFDIALMPAEHMQSSSLDRHISSGAASTQAKRCASKPQSAQDHTTAGSAPEPQGCALQASSGAIPIRCEEGVDGSAQSAQHTQQVQHEGPADSQAPDSATAAYCAAFVGNAPVHGDSYSYHLDADPASLPPCRFLVISLRLCKTSCRPVARPSLSFCCTPAINAGFAWCLRPVDSPKAIP